MASKVFFSDMRSAAAGGLPMKLKKLLTASGFNDIDFKDKFVAIKIHFGQPGNLSFLRPNWAKVVADMVIEKGGKPFLTDCNTLYTGRRKNALDHLTGAMENGFSTVSTNCHLIIADGLKGTDEALIPVKNGEVVKEAKIGKAIADADIIISLNHFKGHETAGFGGAIKNLGMGCGSRAGKMEMHCEGKPTVKKEKCRGCRRCLRACAHSAIKFNEGVAEIDHNRCVGCGRCIGECNFDAIYNSNYNSVLSLNKKMAEYAQAVVQDKPNFHISIVIDVSPLCDCRSYNDVPIVQDIGMFASVDPVAIDRACADAVNAEALIPNSQITDKLHSHEDFHDHFKNCNVNSEWKSCLSHAEKIGLGTQEYELVTVK